MSTYEFAKSLVERHLAYMMQMHVTDTEHNRGERDEAERTLNWLRDIAEVESFDRTKAKSL